MLNIHKEVTLSSQNSDDGNRSSYNGEIEIWPGRFNFVSKEFSLSVPIRLIYYIGYSDDEIFLDLQEDRADYVITSPNIVELQLDITKLFREWLAENKNAFCLPSIFNQGVPLEVIAEWFIDINGFSQLSEFLKTDVKDSGVLERCKDILETVCRIEYKPLIAQMADNIDIISSLFDLPFKEVSIIEEYINNSEVRRCNVLHWLKKSFYGIKLGIIKMEPLEELIEESHQKIISEILPEISKKITNSEIKQIFEEIQDPETLNILFLQIQEMQIVSGLDLLKEDDIFILYYISLHRASMLCAYMLEHPEKIETLFVLFNAKINERSLYVLLHLQAVIEVLLVSADIDLGIILAKFLPLLFEKPGSTDIQLINGWPQVSSGYCLTLYHLQLLNSIVKYNLMCIKSYIITSGIVFSIVNNLPALSEAQKYLSCNILLSTLLKNDRVLRKYIITVNLVGLIKAAVQSIMPVHNTAYSPIIIKIVKAIEKIS